MPGRRLIERALVGGALLFGSGMASAGEPLKEQQTEVGLKVETRLEASDFEQFRELYWRNLEHLNPEDTYSITIRITDSDENSDRFAQLQVLSDALRPNDRNVMDTQIFTGQGDGWNPEQGSLFTADFDLDINQLNYSFPNRQSLERALDLLKPSLQVTIYLPADELNDKKPDIKLARRGALKCSTDNRTYGLKIIFDAEGAEVPAEFLSYIQTEGAAGNESLDQRTKEEIVRLKEELKSAERANRKKQMIILYHQLQAWGNTEYTVGQLEGLVSAAQSEGDVNLAIALQNQLLVSAKDQAVRNKALVELTAIKRQYILVYWHDISADFHYKSLPFTPQVRNAGEKLNAYFAEGHEDYTGWVPAFPYTMGGKDYELLPDIKFR